MFESRRHGGFCHHGVIAFLGFSRRDVADRLQQPAIVEPVSALRDQPPVPQLDLPSRQFEVRVWRFASFRCYATDVGYQVISETGTL